MIKVIPFQFDDYDDLCANTFIVKDENNDAIIIDPSKDYDGFVRFIEKNSLNLKGIFLTHGHFDHIRGVQRILNKFNVPVYVSFYDANLLKDPELNCSNIFMDYVIIDDKCVKTVSEGESINVLSETFKIIETPFHTQGSICYYFSDSDILFTGDTLFADSIGRSDFPTSNSRQIMPSLAKIKKLPTNTKVYPGHGGFGTLEQISKINSFFKY